MERRDFIAGLAGAAVAWPIAARAQEFWPDLWLDPIPANEIVGDRRLSDSWPSGVIEGENFSVVPNGFGIHNDRLDEQAHRRRCDAHAILIHPVRYARIYEELKRRSAHRNVEEMVGAGLVASLARPGGRRQVPVFSRRTGRQTTGPGDRHSAGRAKDGGASFD